MPYDRKHYTRDRRFSYQQRGPSTWLVRDYSGPGLVASCSSRRAALRWIAAARVFTPTKSELACTVDDEKCLAPDPRFCRVGWHRDRAETKDKD